VLTRSAKRLLIIAAASVAMHTFLASAAQATETPPSASASVYVYWSYWDQPSPGTWLPSATGAGAQTPPDGSVIGWRYGVGSVDGTNQTPRSGDTFEQLCATTPSATDKKRVGVVVDSGNPNVAPSGQQPPPTTTGCASVAPASSALQVTGAITAERVTPEGMVCGLGGYPATGCGSQVSLAVATADSSGGTIDSGESSTAAVSTSGVWPTLVGIAVIVVLGAAGILVARNRRG
jgi:hypothetical protein